MKFEIKFQNDIQVFGPAPQLHLVFQDNCGSKKKQSKIDLSVVGVVSHTSSMCGTNLQESFEVGSSENMAAP